MAEIAKIVLLRAKPGLAGELETTLRRLLAASRLEEAARGSELHRSPDEPDLFMVYERWRDDEGFAAHMEQPHTADFLVQAGDLLAEPAEVLAFESLP